VWWIKSTTRDGGGQARSEGCVVKNRRGLRSQRTIRMTTATDDGRAENGAGDDRPTWRKTKGQVTRNTRVRGGEAFANPLRSVRSYELSRASERSRAGGGAHDKTVRHHSILLPSSHCRTRQDCPPSWRPSSHDNRQPSAHPSPPPPRPRATDYEAAGCALAACTYRHTAAHCWQMSPASRQFIH
jgi:hypothetical protein